MTVPVLHLVFNTPTRSRFGAGSLRYIDLRATELW